MKKIYMTPVMEVVKTELEQMISVSPMGSNVYNSSASSSKEILAKERFIEEIQSEGADEDLW